MKVEAHLDAIAGVERDLATLGVLKCQAPAVPAEKPAGIDRIFQGGRLQTDLLLAAMACDLTRVGVVDWATYAAGDLNFPPVNLSREIHAIWHNGEVSMRGSLYSTDTWHWQAEEFITYSRWLAEQMAYMVGRVAAIPELRDNTMIVWVTDSSDGSHDPLHLPVTLWAGSGLGMKVGQSLRLPDRRLYPNLAAANVKTQHSINDLWITVANVMGLDVKTFGDPAYCHGPIAELA